MNVTEIKKDLYKSKNIAKFTRYEKGNLYYEVEFLGGKFEFPISTVEDKPKYVELVWVLEDRDLLEQVILHDTDECNYGIKIPTIALSEDLGETSFNAEVKGSELIRWITKAIENDTLKKIG